MLQFTPFDKVKEVQAPSAASRSVTMPLEDGIITIPIPPKTFGIFR